MINKENEKNKDNLLLYLNCKTFQTTTKGIFNNDPEKIKIKSEFIKYKDLQSTKRKVSYLFRIENNDIKKYEEHGYNPTEKSEFKISVNFNEGHFILNNIINHKNLLKPTENIINIIKNKI